MPSQINSSSRTPDLAPTIVDLPGTNLQFWIHKDYDRGLVQLMVKRKTDRRNWRECEHYVIFTITSNGECYRNSGLPEGWGFRLTKDHKIKEIQ